MSPKTPLVVQGWARVTLLLTLVGLFLGLPACSRWSPAVDTPLTEDDPLEPLKTQLTVDSFNLDQTNEAGDILWTIQAQEAIYRPDEQLAQVKFPQAKLYRYEEVAFELKAQTGEVHQDGKVILLRDKVLIKDLQQGIVLSGNEMEWLPQEATLTLRGDLVGTHDQVNVTAQKAMADTDKRQAELSDQVVVTSADRAFQLKTEALFWDMRQEQITGDRLVQLEHFQEGQVKNYAVGDSLVMDLKTQTASLERNVTLNLQDPQVKVTTDDLTWQIQQEWVQAEQGVQIVYPAENITLAGDRGQLDLAQEQLELTGSVVGSSPEGQLAADQAIWDLQTQDVMAEGNVHYSQENPSFHVRGSQAFGNLQDKRITVTGEVESRIFNLEDLGT